MFTVDSSEHKSKQNYIGPIEITCETADLGPCFGIIKENASQIKLCAMHLNENLINV